MTVVTELFAIKDKLWFWSYYGLHGPCSCKWWYIHDFVSATSRYLQVFSLFIILVWVLLRHLLKKFQPDLKNIITSQHVFHKLHFGAHRHLPTKRNAWEFAWPDLVSKINNHAILSQKSITVQIPSVPIELQVWIWLKYNFPKKTLVPQTHPNLRSVKLESGHPECFQLTLDFRRHCC